MRPPILVVDDDIEVFDSVQNAERSLEPYDIESTTVCDAEGRRLVLELAKRGLADVVRLRQTDEIVDEVQLRSYLIRFLRTRDAVDLSDRIALKELWDLAARHSST
jgi:hypothetical protein